MLLDTDKLLWISDIVMLVLAWKLDSCYDTFRAEMCAALMALACNARVSLESPAAIEQNIALCEQGPAGFFKLSDGRQGQHRRLQCTGHF